MKRLTEKELIAKSKSNLQLLESTVLNQKVSLKELAVLIPGIVHFNNTY